MQPFTSMKARIARALFLFAAIALLDAMLTFHNVWPTLLVHWPGELSLELSCVLLLLAAWQRWRGVPPPALLATLATLFVIGTLGRYAEVTAPALYGREVNLYFDVQYLGSVISMIARVAALWQVVAAVVVTVALFSLLYIAARWSLQRITDAIQSRTLNTVTGLLAMLLVGWFFAQRLSEHVPGVPRFSIPVTATYSQQVSKVLAAVTGRGEVATFPASPAFESTLAASGGSDVIVVFVESYGRSAYDRPEFFSRLAQGRANLDAAVGSTGRGIVSGFVTSPTFGGGSWLAHLSFLSGIQVREADRGQLLMTQSRRTFGDAFAEHGYRRVAVMPGLKMHWPEGSFYGFDQIYDDAGLDYRGPGFGWWRIPDQFSLAKLHALEVEPRAGGGRVRAPLFAFFPTVNTHMPFRPTPPYESDWSRVLGDDPFDASSLQQSLQHRPEWNNLGASYLDSLDYSLQTLSGYVRTHAEDNFIMVIVGDHQPAAAVSGERASWDVPVHIISSRPTLLKALEQRGFVQGTVPPTATVSLMSELGPTLLAAFGDVSLVEPSGEVMSSAEAGKVTSRSQPSFHQ